MIRLAESECRRQLNDRATATYTEAARAVASIANTDPRAILTGVLIDSLISMARFDDARSSIAMLGPDRERRVKALGAIAEAQGRRGLGDSAREWISREPADIRPYLFRRAVDGLLTTLEQYRTKTIVGREGIPGSSSPPPLPSPR